MNTELALARYKDSILNKFRNFLKRMEATDAVKSATVDDDGEVHIVFKEAVDIEGQNVVNVFAHGGAIKKSESKDNKEEQYFEIPAIGEF
jgi:hypothetical protein